MTTITDPDDLSQGGVTSVPDITFSGQSGANVTINSAGANLPAIAAGAYLEIRDGTAGTSTIDSENRGLYEVTGTPTTSAIDLVKQDSAGSVTNPTDNAVAAAARILGSTAAPKNVYLDQRPQSATPVATDRSYIQLINNQGVVSGGTNALSNDGVTIKALYSFLKEEWLSDEDVRRFLFPMVPITDESYEFVEGYEPADVSEGSTVDTGASTQSNTRQLIRTGGWLERNPVGGVKRTYAGIISLGNIFGTNTAYYFFSGQTSATSFAFPGPVNEGVQIFGSTANGGNVDVDFQDQTTDEFNIRIRTFGNTYGQSSASAIGRDVLANQAYSFAVSEAADPVLTDLVTTTISDLFDDIVTTPVAPYNDMAIGYFATAQDRSGFNALGGDTPAPGTSQFGVIVDADASETDPTVSGPASAEQIYAFVQAQLVRSTNINDPDALLTGEAAITIAGQLAEPLLSIASTGNTLFSLTQPSNPGGDGNGVHVDNFAATDRNRVRFRDNDDDERSFPFVATGRLDFNANLSTDTSARYDVFITNDDAGDDLGRDFGTSIALILNDASGPNPISGSVPQQGGGSSVSFDVDYDGNVQRGAASAGTDIPITIVATGFGTAQYVVATGTVTRAENQVFSLVAALERNAVNP